MPAVSLAGLVNMSEVEAPAPSMAPVSKNSGSVQAGRPTRTAWSLVAGVIAGITASACCAGPLVLLLLGISGSWIGNLSALEPLRPIFMVIAVLFLGLAWRRIYVAPKTCAVDAPCAGEAASRKQKQVFWMVSLVVLAAIAFPWYGPLFFE